MCSTRRALRYRLIVLFLVAGCSGHNGGVAGGSHDLSVNGSANDLSATVAGDLGGGCGLVTCASAGAKCGPLGDGCGGVIQCGSCPSPQTCGGGGTYSVCGGSGGCTPKTCLQLGFNCGPAGDGCGGLLDCSANGALAGPCPAGQTCGGGGTPSVCGAGGGGGGGNPDGGSCISLGCGNVKCGPTGDGCGNLISSCGMCTPPQTCGGGMPGTPGVCGGFLGCVPKTCADYPTGTCGQQSDGCGGLTAASSQHVCVS